MSLRRAGCWRIPRSGPAHQSGRRLRCARTRCGTGVGDDGVTGALIHSGGNARRADRQGKPAAGRPRPWKAAAWRCGRMRPRLSYRMFHFIKYAPNNKGFSASGKSLCSIRQIKAEVLTAAADLRPRRQQQNTRPSRQRRPRSRHRIGVALLVDLLGIGRISPPVLQQRGGGLHDPDPSCAARRRTLGVQLLCILAGQNLNTGGAEQCAACERDRSLPNS